jgi:ABC-type Zn uptake system ZnuABC Zn-binding protein ZnuA
LTFSAAIVLSILVAALVAACGSDSDSGTDPGKPTVSATTGILADITERVAGGDATIEQVIPNGTSPHDFQLSAEDRGSIEDSPLLAMDGANLEQGIPVDEIDVPKFVLTDEVQGLLEDDEGNVDPHVWMDPARVAGAIPVLGDALAEADPDHADAYRARAAAYAEELTALDAEMDAKLARVPADNRELVTSHDALGYFADRYGFEVIATPFPASGAEAEASAGRIDEVERAIESAGVPTVFAEAEDDPEVLELIADDTGVSITTDLFVESPGPTGSYAEMLRHDAVLISDGLAGPE